MTNREIAERIVRDCTIHVWSASQLQHAITAALDAKDQAHTAEMNRLRLRGELAP